MMNCYTFGWVPDFARGLVRDLRVRWALEEAGTPYRVTLIGKGEGMTPLDAYRAIQPFGQVPAIVDGDLVLFESGAIVHYIAERSGTLLPADPLARAHVIQWMFAALNSVEVAIQKLAELDLFFPEESWAKERRPAALDLVRQRLAQLAARVDGRDYLVGAFSAADILMTSVLRILRHTDLLEEQPALAAYKQRCEARPAFAKALADHLAVYGEGGVRG